MHSCDQSELRVVCTGFLGEACSFLIQVYDRFNFNKLICEEVVLLNQAARFFLKAPREYRVRVGAMSCVGLSPAAQTIWIKAVPGRISGRELIFYPMIRQQCNKHVDVKFCLTDHHYSNLPIDEGVLTICPNM